MKLVEYTIQLVCKIMKLSLHFSEFILPKEYVRMMEVFTLGTLYL